MLRQQKADFVAAMKVDLAKAQAVLFVDYTGLTVAEADKLRVAMRKSKVGYRVVKNALMRKAVLGTPFESTAKYLKGSPTGVVMGFDDPVTVARTTFEFLKTCQHLTVKGGILDNKEITSAEAADLSKMPNLKELKGGLVALFMGPAGRLISQIKGPGGKIAGIIEKKSTEEGAKA